MAVGLDIAPPDIFATGKLGFGVIGIDFIRGENGNPDKPYHHQTGQQVNANIYVLPPRTSSPFLSLSRNSVRLLFMPKVLHPHIMSQPDVCGGSPCIKGTRITVRTIVVYVLHQGIAPEDLLSYYPHLSLATIYDALAYYYDNREELDAEIADNNTLDP